MSKVIGIDYGEKRVGVALSDDEKRYAFPFITLENSSQESLVVAIKKICQKEGVEKLVIGLPLDQHGQVGKKAREVKGFTKVLKTQLGIPVEFEDERFSSAMASELSREAGKTARQTRGTLDQQSAQIILQSYLDKKHG